MVSFPLRVVYAINRAEANAEDTADTEANAAASSENGIKVRMLVSVPKKHFKRAVKRNRVKRQVREAYRKNKHSLCDAVAAMPSTSVDMAFVWLDDSLHESSEVERKVAKLLLRIEERLVRNFNTEEKREGENSGYTTE